MGQQTKEFWLKELQLEKYQNINIVLFGVGLFPWQIDFPEDIHFAYLKCDQSARKERLFDRGGSHLWDTHKKDVQDVANRLDNMGAKCFETGNCSVEESADNIKKWILTLR